MKYTTVLNILFYRYKKYHKYEYKYYILSIYTREKIRAQSSRF